MQRSTVYTCTKPFDDPDDWFPVWLEGVCVLDDPEIFAGKSKFEVPLASLHVEPETAWHDLPPVQVASLGSFTTPRADHVPIWQGSHVSMFTASTVTHHTTTPEPIPPIPLPAGGLMLITALLALMTWKGLRG